MRNSRLAPNSRRTYRGSSEVARPPEVIEPPKRAQPTQMILSVTTRESKSSELTLLPWSDSGLRPKVARGCLSVGEGKIVCIGRSIRVERGAEFWNISELKSFDPEFEFIRPKPRADLVSLERCTRFVVTRTSQSEFELNWRHCFEIRNFRFANGEEHDIYSGGPQGKLTLPWDAFTLVRDGAQINPNEEHVYLSGWEKLPQSILLPKWWTPKNSAKSDGGLLRVRLPLPQRELFLTKISTNTERE